MNGVDDIYINSTASHISQVEEAIVPMELTKSLGQSMPLQRLLAALKLNALVHMVICKQLPVLELNQKQMEFPWINDSRVRIRKVHRITIS